MADSKNRKDYVFIRGWDGGGAGDELNCTTVEVPDDHHQADKEHHQSPTGNYIVFSADIW